MTFCCNKITLLFSENLCFLVKPLKTIALRGKYLDTVDTETVENVLANFIL